MDTQLTRQPEIQNVLRDGGDLIVTETRTIRVQRTSAPHQPCAPRIYYDDQGNADIDSPSQPPSDFWLWLLAACCIVAVIAACADIIQEFAIVAQDNPVGIIIVGAILGIAALLIPTGRGRY